MSKAIGLINDPRYCHTYKYIHTHVHTDIAVRTCGPVPTCYRVFSSLSNAYACIQRLLTTTIINITLFHYDWLYTPTSYISTHTNIAIINGCAVMRRKFNVSVTRGMALCIIIGHPYVLGRDAQWRKLMDYCIRNSKFTSLSRYRRA